MAYHPPAVAAYFDSLGESEWARLEATLHGRIKYALHRHFLTKYVAAGMHVLDVGCGPGRFALDLVRLGATVTLVDLSQVQLDLARERLAEAHAMKHVRGFHRLDVLDLHSLGTAHYDAVVCFGGAVSYTRERYLDALRQLAVVGRPGSPVLLSVMSLFGSLRLVGPLDAAAFLKTANDHLDWLEVLSGAGVTCTRPGSSEFHQPIALFTAEALRLALTQVGFQVETMATSNPLVPGSLKMPRTEQSPDATDALITLEIALCEQPGLVDSGEHLIAIARNALRPGAV